MPRPPLSWTVFCHVLLLLATSAVSALSGETPAQVPLTRPLAQYSVRSRPRWPLNFTSTAPHLFSSTSSLLQQWGNTFFPNGHAIVACEIAPYTLFYHGRQDDEMPPSPEWLAFDLGMAYGIMGSFPNSHILTYQTTKPTRAIYFDGESATLMGLGQLDSQMLQIYGNVSGPPLGNNSGGPRGLGAEYARAHGLCNWLLRAGLRGPGWGFEGLIRMNAAFEVIWCDFTSPSLRFLSQVNVTAPLLPVDEGQTDHEGRAGESVAEETQPQEEEEVLELRRRRLEDPQESDPPPYYTLPPQPTRTDSSSDPTKPAMPPNWRRSGREPFLTAQTWGWFDSAVAHYGGPVAGGYGSGFGETRARVLPCGILSYYSPRFAHLSAWRAGEERSRLNLTESGYWGKGGAVEEKSDGDGSKVPSEDRQRALQDLTRRRRLHHLANTTTEEAEAMRRDVERTLKRYVGSELELSFYSGADSGMCSGANWVVMTNEIKQSTTTQIKETILLLSGFPLSYGDSTSNTHAIAGTANTTALRSWLANLRSLNHLFMVSYLEYPKASSISPNEDPSTIWSTHSNLYAETYSRCRYRYTRLMAAPSSPSTTDPFNHEEQDLRWSVEETFGAICSVLLTIGFGIEQAWDTHFQHPHSQSKDKSIAGPDAADTLRNLAGSWTEGLDELVAWLGWSDEFTGCTEVCAWDERCYIPIWPFIQFGGPPGGMPAPPRNGTRPGRPPLHGGDGPGRGHPGGGPPSRDGRFFDETDLWEPKCIKASYFERG
ncbi:hypothetical protein F5Y18DRAFT_409318 [Xylariaceae sp. FL1019]|nr:hypothetical protein F5Y18DRAFT_409318 [Xylariaceae sp. FL1019]